MKAVFDTKPSSAYDDDVSQHYQFPRRYLALVRQCIGDWVVLRRPRADGGNLAYFAVARVAALEIDQKNPKLTYARLSEYLPFDSAVPWKIADRYAEAELRRLPRQEVGVYLRGRSVRPLSDDDFQDLVVAGLQNSIADTKFAFVEVGEARDVAAITERVRRIEQVLTSRLVRDANFRRTVCGAYRNTCAVTGIRVTDAAGNAEAQAAHIWAVSKGGPDITSNGIALSATVHWLFDHFLISISDDYQILINPKRVPLAVQQLLLWHSGTLLLPANKRDWPHQGYLAKHREAFHAALDLDAG